MIENRKFLFALIEIVVVPVESTELNVNKANSPFDESPGKENTLGKVMITIGRVYL